MTMDLTLYPISKSEGREQSRLYSLHVTEAAGRATRSRKIDRLILYLVMTGDELLRPDQQDQLLVYLAEIYFKTSGSATAAMRRINEELNRILLEINLRYARKGQQGIGWLSAAVLRAEQFYLTQSGPMSAFLIKTGLAQHLYDPSMIGRGLGQGRSTPISYYQADLRPGESLLLAAQPSSSWNIESLDEMNEGGPVGFRRRLFDQSAPDTNAVLIQAKEGDGNIFISGAKAASPETHPESTQVSKQQIEAAGGTIIGLSNAQAAPPVYQEYAPTQDEGGTAEQEQKVSEDDTAFEPAVETQQEVSGKRANIDLSPVRKAAGAFIAMIAGFLRGVGRSFKPLLLRISPAEDFLKIPSSTMALIALTVPVLMVIVSGVAYFKLGRAAQYDVLYTQAQELGLGAESQTDLSAQRAKWEAVLKKLDQVEEIDITPETLALRAKATSILDEMDIVKRVNFQTAIIGGLPDSAQISRMLVIDNDLYMLDETSGNVIRAQLTSQGYKLDSSFQCGPGVEGDNLVGSLIDIARWSEGHQPDAELVVFDSSGNMLFCNPGEVPKAGTLSAPPSTSLDDLAAMTINLGDVYVVDPRSNAVWIYWNGEFGNEPELFFNAEIPRLEDVVDLTVNYDELYLLHSDGSLTLCVFSGLGVAPTRCSDLEYEDLRPGHENTPMTTTDPFTQILLNPPPDPSLYFLEPQSRAIYHFSLRNLAYQKQYKSHQSLADGEATAVAVDPVKRNFFLAIGNNVYYGIIP
jgi:hypothetical protein